MEKHLHWDGAAGAAGDMLLASLIDAGADSVAIREALGRLPLGHWRMTASEVLRGGIAATHVDVVDLSEENGVEGEADGAGDGDTPEPEVQPPPHHVHTHDDGQPTHCGHAVHTHEHPHRHASALEMHRLEHEHVHEHEHGHEHHSHDHGHGHDHHHDHPHRHDHAHGSGGPHRHLSDLLALAAHPSIPERARKRAERVFRALAVAEARVHGVTPEQVHFHEVSGLDTAVDVLGVCLALEDLDIDTVSAAPPFVGSGTLRIAHGVLPVPAPATLELLCSGNRPWIGEGRGELLTPTGAALLVTLTDAFSPPPRGFRVEHVGYGAGTRDSADRPNVVRAQVGALDRSVAAAPAADDVTGEGRDVVVTYTCVLDDLAPEAAGYLAEHLFEAGAAEVYWVPAVMKKSRPGFELTVLAAPDRAEAVEAVLWRESSTFGFRRRVDARRVLARQFRTVTVSGQAIRIKVGFLEGRAIRRQPEYEDCRVAARALRRPLVDVMREAMTAAAGLQETR